MSVPVFGITQTQIRDHYFPSLSAFSTSTIPTTATVLEMVSSAAAVIGGRMARRGLAPAAFSADAGATYPLAYAWVQRYIRLHAAIAAYQAMAGGGAVPEAWKNELAGMEKEFEDLGLDALGDAPSPSLDSDGPRSHIGTHGLDTGDDLDRSDAVPRFRKGDAL